jgi:RNA 2',3'-cyclic 3'-phosphodiesterase
MERLFAALDLPDEVRDGLEAWGARELIDPALRPVRAESLHMTVCFLGWTPPERAEEAKGVIRAIEPRPVKIRLLPEPLVKPPRRPSLFAVEAEAPAAAVLAGEVSARYCELGLAEEEKRPFWPHVTVARVRSEKGEGRPRRRRPQHVERPPEPLPESLGGEFLAVRLCLYRSMMRRDGSQYVPLCNLNLR